ncbi:hypothetical protein [Tumebacillus permanentifrigoris]|uniref:Phr family secreted Rap phosphatase inhibitor n=1 Tax=Tumebacillus permanentifrigoris TaxID=378543 RepID=A0A316DAT2_9BACL|nr:hypothetical protein [Tumebacillus permanentifrigoris]PWK13800.1 hypothetical protein C7459_10680 [Tumebacillus permanentifrigoris]
MKLKVWMGIALVCSLLVAGSSSIFVAEMDPPLPFSQANQVAINDQPDPFTITVG